MYLASIMMSSGGFSVDTQKQQNKTRQQFCSYVFLVAPFAGGREEQSRGGENTSIWMILAFFSRKNGGRMTVLLLHGLVWGLMASRCLVIFPCMAG